MEFSEFRIPKRLLKVWNQKESIEIKIGRRKDYWGNFLDLDKGFFLKYPDEVQELHGLLPQNSEQDTDGFFEGLGGKDNYKNILPIGLDGDRSLICLDYRASKYGGAIIWKMKNTWRKVCPTFLDFLYLLESPKAQEILLEK